jgi:hypothetical protein
MVPQSAFRLPDDYESFSDFARLRLAQERLFTAVERQAPS